MVSPAWPGAQEFGAIDGGYPADDQTQRREHLEERPSGASKLSPHDVTDSPRSTSRFTASHSRPFSSFPLAVSRIFGTSLNALSRTNGLNPLKPDLPLADVLVAVHPAAQVLLRVVQVQHLHARHADRRLELFAERRRTCARGNRSRRRTGGPCPGTRPAAPAASPGP